MSDSADRLKSPVKTGDVVGGKYRVEKVLGAGGMGVVVAATHVDLDQKVALKFILPQALAGKGNVERFLREARAVVRLKSEHVAKVFDVGREAVGPGEEERPYMVLELLEGMDLAKLNREKGPFAVADAVEYVLQACEALVEAHALGIVHRDLKPQNLFVTRRLNGTPLVKVLDFGISKAVGPAAEGQMSLTDSTAVIGSPLYMAPEQMRSARAAEIRSDIWALGVILYELLGGQLPFDGETVTEVCIRVVNEAPPELMKLRPGLDEKLVAIVMRCLEKDIDARFHNVASLATALEPFSRSAQQGGLVRPWRSFEDTQDSHEVARSPQGILLSTPADATGPATAVTMDSLPPDALAAISDEERRAREKAGGTQVSSGVKPPSARDGERHPLVSTDTTWGDSTGKQPKKTRSFATGLAAGAVVSLAVAAGVVGVMLGRSSNTPSKANAGGGVVATATATAPASATAPAAATAPATATAAAAATEEAPVASKVDPKAGSKHARPLPPIATASGPAGRILGAKGAAAAAARTAEPATAPPPPAATTHAPESKSDPAAPNGAPILH